MRALALTDIRRYLEDRLDSYLSELSGLVNHDSGSFDRDGVNVVVDRLEGHLDRLGFEVTRHHHDQFGDDLVARRRGTGSGQIMLLGHSDTVYPPGTTAERPMRIVSDRVLGPGTCDMKAGLLSGIYAAEALQGLGLDNYGTLTFVVVSDEEIGERHSVKLIMDEGAAHDAVLTLEAARENGDIVVSRKAVKWCRIDAHGRAAHAGVEPEKGASATVALAKLVGAVHDLNGLRAGMTVNVAPMSGGQAPNIVADSATARLDLRAWTNDDLCKLEARVRELADRVWIDGVSMHVGIELGSECPAMERTAGVVALEHMAQSIAQALGFSVAGAATGGVSDISYASHDGTPGLDGLGPVGGLDHSPREYVELSSIVPRTTLLAGLILGIADGGVEGESRHHGD